VTVSWVEVAVVTVATVPLNFTTLLVAELLKFVPVIVTVELIGPDVGVKLVNVGANVVLPVEVPPADEPPPDKARIPIKEAVLSFFSSF